MQCTRGKAHTQNSTFDGRVPNDAKALLRHGTVAYLELLVSGSSLEIWAMERQGRESESPHRLVCQIRDPRRDNPKNEYGNGRRKLPVTPAFSRSPGHVAMLDSGLRRNDGA